MQEKLQDSVSTTAVFLAVALALVAGAESCQAGDKIDFSVPGNAAVAQQPEREAPVEDAADPLRLNSGAQDLGGGLNMPAIETTIIMPAEKTKRNGLRAWDSGLNSQDLDGRDGLPAEAKAPMNAGLTNDVDGKSEWEAGLPRTDGFTGFEGEKSQEQAAAAARSGASALSGLNRDDQNAMDDYGSKRESDNAGLAQWSKSLAPADETDVQRMREQYQYRSIYNSAAPDIGGAGTLPLVPSTADNATVGTAAENDNLSLRGNGSSALDAFSSVGDTSGEGARHAYPMDGSTGFQGQGATRPAYPGQYNSSSQTMMAQPAILPFPKKPGSLFQ